MDYAKQLAETWAARGPQNSVHRRNLESAIREALAKAEEAVGHGCEDAECGCCYATARGSILAIRSLGAKK